MDAAALQTPPWHHGHRLGAPAGWSDGDPAPTVPLHQPVRYPQYLSNSRSGTRGSTGRSQQTTQPALPAVRPALVTDGRKVGTSLGFTATRLQRPAEFREPAAPLDGAPTHFWPVLTDQRRPSRCPSTLQRGASRNRNWTPGPRWTLPGPGLPH